MRFLVVAILAISIANADSNSINLNGIDLTLGMDRSTVLEKLRFGSDLVDQSSPTQGIFIWRVRSKSFGSEGTVQFVNDKLVGVNVEKGQVEGEAATILISRLYSLLKEAEQSGEKISVRTGSELETVDRWRWRDITFLVGQRELQLRVYEPIGGPAGRVSRISLKELLIKTNRE